VLKFSQKCSCTGCSQGPFSEPPHAGFGVGWGREKKESDVNKGREGKRKSGKEKWTREKGKDSEIIVKIG